MTEPAHHNVQNVHSISTEELLALLHSNTKLGLTTDEVTARLAQHGSNALPEPAKRTWLQRFFAQFANALIGFLLVAAVLAAVLGHWVDASVIVLVVLVNALVGVLQEGKAEQAMNALRDMLSPHARVIRDGVQQEIDVVDLVPGDIVLLEAGDRVPADIRLTRARALRIDEALLTGESVVAEKNQTPPPTMLLWAIDTIWRTPAHLLPPDKAKVWLPPPAALPKSAKSAPCWATLIH